MCSECSESAPLNTARGALTSLQFKYGGGTGQNDVRSKREVLQLLREFDERAMKADCEKRGTKLIPGRVRQSLRNTPTKENT